jgi:hypothetical protein
MHAWRPVRPATLLDDVADQLCQTTVLAGSIALRSTKPRVETAPGDLQGLAHQAHLEDLPVVADELKLQLLSFAK